MIAIKRIVNFSPPQVFARNHQVTIVGGGSEIGQTIGLLLRTQPSISKLVVHDNVEHTPGVVLDLSHIPTNSSLQGYVGNDNLERAIKKSDLIIVAGGELQHSGMSQETILDKNIDYIKKLAVVLGKSLPMAFIGIVTEPINILVPMAAEIMRNHGGYDHKKLFGITSSDHLRARALYTKENNLDTQICDVPVIGGHSNETALPLLSQAKPRCHLQSDEQKVQEFIAKYRSQQNVSKQTNRDWAPMATIAFGVLTFVRGILDALNGRTTRIHAYIENNDFGTSYFSGLVHVDKNGAGEMERYSNLSKLEYHLLERCIEQIRKDVLMGKKLLELA